MKKVFAMILTLAMLLGLLMPVSLADNGAEEAVQGGRLLISEAGEYTLTGSMKGTVYVDPGHGEVTLVLDNVTIDGVHSAAIVAVSGDSLTIAMADGSVNTLKDGDGNTEYGAVIYSEIDTRMEGNGRLNITGNSQNGLTVNGANLTFANGTYAIVAVSQPYKVDGTLSLGEASFVDTAKPTAQEDDAAERKATASQATTSTQETQESEATQESKATQQETIATESEPIVESAEEAAVSQAQEDRPEIPEKPEGAPEAASDSSWSDPGQEPAQDSMPGEMNPESVPEGTDPRSRGNMPDGMIPSQGDAPDGMARDQGRGPDGMGPNQGNMPGDAGSSNYTLAEEPSQVVTSTAENSAYDLEANLENAETITMSEENNQVKITSSGTYVVTGSSSDGNITVKKGTTGVVLVLEDLDLTSTSGAAVSVNKQAEVKIIISGEVTITDGENPEDEDSEDEKIADAYDGAAMKFKADSNVVITGDGTLNIHGDAKNGIKSGDNTNLIIEDVTLNISAANDGINGNFDVTVLSGNVTIEAGDDAIHADHILTVGSEGGPGPVINISSCYEGLEGTVVNLFAGDVSIHSTDDAVNAANGDGAYEGELGYAFNMMGGSLVIESESDGIDSNGDINLLGGSATISSASFGGEAGIDYDGQLYISEDFELTNRSGIAGPDEMPGGNGNMPVMGEAPQGQPPEMPDGNGMQQDDNGTGHNDNPPAPPQNGGMPMNGEAPQGQPPEMPEGNGMQQDSNGIRQNDNRPAPPENSNMQMNGEAPQGQPPEMPEGNAMQQDDNGTGQNDNPPAPPENSGMPMSGEVPQGQPPEMPSEDGTQS